MNKINKVNLVLIISIIVLIVLRIPKDSRPDIENISSKDLREYIISSSNELSPESAYFKLKETFTQAPYSQQHLSVHFFGEWLYDTVGVKGIAVCDEAFGFGCYHGLFSKAIKQEGEAVVQILDQECVSQYGELGLGCPHGIGHGLGELYGPNQIDKQLEVCSQLTWQGDLFGCSGGVFMENNSPTIIDAQLAKSNTRELDPNNPYYPCQNVTSRYRRSCYFEIASWWMQAFNQDVEKIGKLCGNIVNHLEKQDCYRGLGNVIVESSVYDVKKTQEYCSLLSDRQAILACRGGSAWAYFSNPNERHKAKDVCSQGLTQSETLNCEELANTLDLPGFLSKQLI